jgi:hypothetical protein
MPLTRRAILAFACFPFLPRLALSAGYAAVVTKVGGPVTASLPDGTELGMTSGLALPAGARFATGGTLVELALTDGTRLHAGRSTSVTLAAGPGSEAAPSSVNISGIAVVDRRSAGADAPLTVTSDGFEILLADSQVFLDSLARPAVFVQAGTATVDIGTEQIVLASGEGVDLLPPDLSKTTVVRWGPERVTAAFASVGLTV